MRPELRIPISPTPSFVNQVLLQVASLRRFYPDAIARIYVGHANPTPEMRALIETSFSGHRIGYEWVTGKSFTQWEGTRAPYLETINRRWSRPVSGDAVIIADADIIFVGTLDDILVRDAVQGTQAHVPPMTEGYFRHLFRICEVPAPPFDVPHTGGGFMAPPGVKGPFYPNSGMVILPRQYFEVMTPHYHLAINRMRQALNDFYWFDQLALSIAATAAQVPFHPLPVKFNCPNQIEFEEHYPEDLRDVRVIHYMREHLISRTKDFESVTALRRLVQRDDFSGSHEILRRAIAANMTILEPAALNRPEDAPYA